MQDFNHQNQAKVPRYCVYNIDIQNQHPKTDPIQVFLQSLLLGDDTPLSLSGLLLMSNKSTETRNVSLQTLNHLNHHPQDLVVPVTVLGFGKRRLVFHFDLIDVISVRQSCCGSWLEMLQVTFSLKR